MLPSLKHSVLLLSVCVVALLAGVFAPKSSAVVAPQSDTNVVINPNLYQDLRWRSVGPHRGGRSTAVAGVRTQPNVFYLGATGGGVWKTENYGITWSPVSDWQMTTPSIGAIDVSDSNPNVVYVGTGSEAIRSNVILGRGVYKSIDAGKTWQFVGLKDCGQIGQLKVHPKNPDIAYVAVVGNPFAWGAERGVYRTKDGGKTWTKVLTISNETGAVSIAINWSSPNEVYAGAWRAQRRPWTIISGGPASEGGIYKTTDGGDHWIHLTNGLPQNLIGKVWLDIAQSNPKIVYAMVEAPEKEGGLYRSDDHGATWTLVNSDTRLRARPFYFNKMFVNPKDENDVWITELGFHHSTDGGKTFGTVGTPHGDNHSVWINPDNPKIFIESNDGGANITQDGGRSWSSIFNQPTAEFYMVDVDNEFPYRLYGPQQDNSTVAIYNVPPFGWGSEPTQTWIQASGCESGQIRATPDGKIIYGDCKGEFGRYNVDTGQEQHYWINPEQRYGMDPKDMKFRFVRQAPIEIDPFNPKVVYHGSQFLHKTSDGGIHWAKISPDLTANGPEAQMHGGEPITRDVTGEEVYAALYAIRASRSEPGVIWTGANDGLVWLTRDGGKTWKNVTPHGLPPGGRVHTIEDSPHRKGSAYVCVYRIYFGDFKPYLYLTNDYGEHWTLLTDGRNGIPEDHPMHVVREDPQQEGLLYAGTWYGAFVSFDQGRHWQTLQQNLPTATVTDIFVKDDDLVISTMGRSFWIMDNIAPLRQLAASVTRQPTRLVSRRALNSPLPEKIQIKAFDGSSNIFLFAPEPTYRTRYAPSAGRPDRPEYPPVGVRIDYALTNTSGEVKLEIVDSAGKVIRSYSSEGGRATAPQGGGGGGGFRGRGAATTLPKKVGMNRFMWDLRYPGGTATGGGGGEEGGFTGAGPLAPPGTYTARLTAGGTTKTESFIVRIDPRYAKDGLTVADLVEQTSFALKVRDSLAEVRRLGERVKQAMDRSAADKARLETLYYKIVNRPGPYPDNMLIEQFANIGREIGQADQKVGASAYERYEELLGRLASMKIEVDKAIGPASP